MRGIVKVEFTEFSSRLEVGEQGELGGGQYHLTRVSCLERSWAWELGRLEFES